MAMTRSLALITTILLLLWVIILIWRVVFLSKSVNSGIVHLDNILGWKENPTEQNINHCTPQIRKKYYWKMCQEEPVLSKDGKARDIIVDEDRQNLGCLIGKASSMSWKIFLFRLGSQADCTSLSKFRPGSKCLDKNHLHYDKDGIPSSQLNEEYKHFKKYIIVRHPLQRLVSGYFQMHGNLKTYADYDQQLFMFKLFVTHLVIDTKFAGNHHYLRYTDQCDLCKIKYDLVMRTETLKEDIKVFKEQFNIDAEEEVPMSHMSKNISYAGEDTATAESVYKYDKMLHDFQRSEPDLMKALLNYYSYDMQVLGYSWDWDEGKSSCQIQLDGNKCC